MTVKACNGNMSDLFSHLQVYHTKVMDAKAKKHKASIKSATPQLPIGQPSLKQWKRLKGMKER